MLTIAELSFPFMEGLREKETSRYICNNRTQIKSLCPFINLAAHLVTFCRITEIKDNTSVIEQGLSCIGDLIALLLKYDALKGVMPYTKDSIQMPLQTYINHVSISTNNVLFWIKKSVICDTLLNKDICAVKDGLCRLKDGCDNFFKNQKDSSRMGGGSAEIYEIIAGNIPLLEVFLSKIKEIDDNIPSRDSHFKNIYDEHLAVSRFNFSSPKTFKRQLCESVSMIASSSKIWEEEYLNSLRDCVSRQVKRRNARTKG